MKVKKLKKMEKEFVILIEYEFEFEFSQWKVIGVVVFSFRSRLMRRFLSGGQEDEVSNATTSSSCKERELVLVLFE